MTIPIVFVTDRSLVMPTCVSISSLLLNAKADDYYDVYIILDKDIDETSRNKLQALDTCFTCSITLIDFAYSFQADSGTWGTDTIFYRLFIPQLIPEHDKIFYSDVDVIFRNSISELYNTNLEEYYLAATKCLSGDQYIHSIGCDPYTYFCSGFMLLNSKKMRDDNLIMKFSELMSSKFASPDQDMLNIVCKGKVAFFSPELCVFDQFFYFHIMKGKNVNIVSYTEQELQEAIHTSIIHYIGVDKPWKNPCWRNDIWWEYYKKHPYYDEKFYFEKQLCFKNGDYFTLKQRLRLIIRYFLGEKGVLRKLFK
jgi:lipopolysaccharide biosynthesis glycosyltransferase